jgi:signal transduction histidine kinase
MQPDQPARVLSLLSHELRGPLGVIRGYLRLLDQTGADLSAEHRQVVAAALKASDRAADLLTQTSMLAQLQREETPFAFRPLELQDLLTTAVAGVHVPGEPSVHIEIGDVPAARVSADRPLLQGALTTLIAAVVRAQVRETTLRIVLDDHPRGGAGGVSIRIAADTSPDTPTEVALDITRGGLGLELPIAQHLIAAHGGELGELRCRQRYAGVVVWLPTTS